MNRILAEITDIQKCLGHEWNYTKKHDSRTCSQGQISRTMITFGCSLAKQQQASLLSGLFRLLLCPGQRLESLCMGYGGLADCSHRKSRSIPAMRFFGRRPLLLVCSVISALTMFWHGLAHDKGTSFEPKRRAKPSSQLSIPSLGFTEFGQARCVAITSETPSQRLRSRLLALQTDSTSSLVALFILHTIFPQPNGPKLGG